jgi:dihydropteroate synthase
MNKRDLTNLLISPNPGSDVFRPIIMGILNVTPDSFSDGGEFNSIDAAVSHALQMVRDGAEIIDIGGESTRPAGAAYGAGAAAITEEEELRRVIPVIEAIRKQDPNILISIDTQKSSVAQAAIDAGADIINDVSAGTTDPNILDVAAKHKTPIILMHGHGPNFSKPKIEDYHYENVVEEVKAYLARQIAAARGAGCEAILADVGIGFGKTYSDNLRLLKHHASFASLNVSLVLGVSRKSTIGRAIGNKPPKERVVGSVAAACYGAEHGAKIIRTHDVRETREALAVISAIITEGSRSL